MIDQARAAVWAELRRLGYLIADLAAQLHDLTNRVTTLEQHHDDPEHTESTED